MASYSIADLNGMDESTFVQLLGTVFEETPQVAAQAWRHRPFQDVADLHSKMVSVVEKEMTSQAQVMLIRAHPELGASGKMAAASVQEQAGVGLNKTTEETQQQVQQIREWNVQYREKFGFPFVMAVKGQTLDSIATALKARLSQEKACEIAKALSEIYKIAHFRLNDLITE